MKNWTVNHLQKQIDDLSMRLYDAENKFETMREYFDKYDIPNIENKIKIHQEWIEICQKWIDTQIQLNKMIKV